MVRVSIVVPVYNRLDRLRDVLRSLLNQDLSEPYEVIVVDDGSTDGCCDGIELLDSRIIVVRQENRGAAIARYRGVCESRGDLVAFHDSDDLAEPNKVSALVTALDKYPQCGCAIAVTKGVEGRWKMPEWVKLATDDGYYVFQDPLSHYFDNYYPLAGAMNIAIRRKLALLAAEGNGFYKAANDYHLQFKLAMMTSIVAVPIVTVNYFSDSDNSISKIHGHGLQQVYSVCSLIENYNKLGDLSDKYKDRFCFRIKNELPQVLLYLIRNRRTNVEIYPLILCLVKYTKITELPKQFYWAWLRLADTK